tara:strand:+ start:693 stop:1475 length:783 start_codon:yes stop_codon:yes gene_type:complete
MHTPGHNPFFESYIQPGFGEGYMDFISAQAPYMQSETHNELAIMRNALQDYVNTHGSPYSAYNYSNVDQNILGALQNVFEGYTPTGLYSDEEIQAMQDLYAETTNPALTITGGVQEMLNQNVLNLGPENLSGVNIFDPESIASVLSNIGELGDVPIKAGEIEALTPEMLEKTESQYYSPYEEAERASLVEKRGENIAGAQTGGFAGSGGRRAGLSAADRMYSAGYGNIIADIMKMKAAATGDVMDTIYGWQELLSSQEGG